MNRRLRKIIFRSVWILIGILFIGVASVTIYVRTHEQEIIQYVLREIDQSLKGEIRVKQVRVSILPNFPRVSLVLDHLHAQGSAESDPRPLAVAEKIELHFNLWNIIAKRYEIRSIEVQGAEIYLRTYADSSVNYAIWEGSEGDNPLIFSLKRIILNRVAFHQHNSLSGTEYSLYTKHSSAAGRFSAQEQSFRIKSKLRIDRFAIEHQTIIDSIDIDIRTVMQHQLDSERRSSMMIRVGDIRWDGMHFSTQGSLTWSEGKQSIDLSLDGKNIVLEDLLTYLPTDMRCYLEEYEFKGGLDLGAHIHGAISGDRYPLVSVRCALKQGQVYHTNSHQTLSNLAFAAHFKTLSTSGPLSYQAYLTQVQGRWKSGAFNGQVSLDSHSNIRLQASLNADLGELHEFFDIPGIDKVSGRIKAQARLQQRWDPSQDFELSQWLYRNHQIALHGSNIQLDLQDFKQHLTFDSIQVRLSNGDIQQAFINGYLDQTSFETQFKAHRLISYIKGDAPLFLDADIRIPKLNIPKSEGVTDSSRGLLSIIPSRIHGHVRVRAGQVIYDSIHLTDFRTEAYLQDQLIDIEHFEAHAFGGRIHGRLEGRIENKTIALNMSGQLKELALDQVFKDFHDFGQGSLTHKHIRGTVDMDYHLSASWVSGAGIDPESIILSTRNRVKDGELVKFPTLQKLSRFIDEETLEHIKFSSLENYIDIKNSLVMIPEMTVGSNAMNLSLIGTHHFDGRIDYTVRIALSELLSKRRRERRRQKDLEAGAAIKDDGKRTAIYVHIGGTVDAPVFSYRLKAGSLELTEGLRKEKTALKEALNSEFSHQSERRAAIEKEKSQWQEQEKGQFIIDLNESIDTIVPIPKPTKKAPLKKDTARIKVIFDD